MADNSGLTSALEGVPAQPGRDGGYVANPGFRGSSVSGGGPGSLCRSRGSAARRSVVAELHEVLERVDPLERLAVLGELQGLVLADVVRAEVAGRLG